jgi:hypothetical protein
VARSVLVDGPNLNSLGTHETAHDRLRALNGFTRPRVARRNALAAMAHG